MQTASDSLRKVRRAAQKAALAEVGEFLGGDGAAYVIAGFLYREARVDTVAGLRALPDPTAVHGIGVAGAVRIRRALDGVR